MEKIVREFSTVGPCIPLGRLIKETAKFYVYADRFEGGATKRIAKRAVHIEACPSCRDHPRTQYPHGYMD